ncbi:MAG: ATP-binding cassette domain-containing protein, partial [Gammaproteobacteria bacterium]|nr:ATP-binding cassette domain-containing protein [Gammaproteobacteria bacterium]
MANATAASVQGVSRSFGDVQAVEDLSLAVPQGTIFGIIGPNGAGKTTTIRMLVGILAADAGTIN